VKRFTRTYPVLYQVRVDRTGAPIYSYLRMHNMYHQYTYVPGMCIASGTVRGFDYSFSPYLAGYPLLLQTHYE